MNANIIATVSRDLAGYDRSLDECAILPAQFFLARRGSVENEPLRRLMFAVLIDAVRCYQSNLNAGALARQRLFREARLWLFSKDGDMPFSFDSVCTTLEVDPYLLRRWLLDWRAKLVSGDKPRGLIRRSPNSSRSQIRSRPSSKRPALQSVRPTKFETV